MDVDKGITTTEFKLFNWTVFKIIRRYERNYLEEVEPLLPVVEINVNKKDVDI